MADVVRKNRLSPPLMFVFRAAHQARDAQARNKWREDAGVAAETRSRAQQRAPITEAMLRREVGLDLENLMNCVSLESTLDLSDFPRARRSIINFGLPDLVHRSIDELAAKDIDGDIEEVVRVFEPRLVTDTVRVTRDTSVDAAELKVRYVVHGDLSCEPLNVPVEFVADVEVATGKIQIRRA
jgi:type VI secretion system protein ImpF